LAPVWPPWCGFRASHLLIFNNHSTLTSAILDRVLHHAETILLEGKSYRMKDRFEP
jgi:DNA replication protein DnaC